MKLSLRARIAVTTGLIALIAIATAGAVIALQIDHRDRRNLDTELMARAQRVAIDADKLASVGAGSPAGDDDSYGSLLDGSESLVRLLQGDTVIAQRGAAPEHALPPPTAGFSTVNVDGSPWRSYAVDADDGLRLQVLQSLEPPTQRTNANRRLIAVVTVLAAGLAAAAGWLAGSRLLRPLRQLSAGAAEITNDPDHGHRLPAVTDPPEIASLSDSLNRMLDRLDASAETTRRFAADVGHELRGPLTTSAAYLETVLAVPDLPAQTVQRPLTAIQHQQQRMTDTLNALQILARGDARALPDAHEVELGVLVGELVRIAGHRHPTCIYSVTDMSNAATVLGLPDSLRIAVDNLLDNAALHGRHPNGHVRVTVSTLASTVNVVVDDDGKGIPRADRDNYRQRFARGPGEAAGSGLGLALVDQQAALHGGHLTLDDSPLGGLRAVVTIPVSPGD